jgi:hypothetical protein
MRDGTCLIACVPKSKRITSVVATVAPHVCDLVRGARGVQAPARPVICSSLLLSFSPD